MSEEQLKELLAKIKEDAGLREKLVSAADLDALVKIANESGFQVSAESRLSGEISDSELEVIAGGNIVDIAEGVTKITTIPILYLFTKC